jgi:hypothetical protein
LSNFNEKLPEWYSEGNEPSEQKKNEGWEVEEKPPAGLFNWLFNRAYKSIKELQEKAETVIGAQEKVDAGIQEAKGYTDQELDAHLAQYAKLGAVLTYTQSTGQSVPANTLTTLSFAPSEDQFMKCLGSQFEVKKAGGYLIQLMFYVANSTPDGTNFLLQLALNTDHAHSVRLKHSPIVGDFWAVYDIIHSIQLRAGDIVEVKFRHNAGNAINSQYSRMKFTWLGNGGL